MTYFWGSKCRVRLRNWNDQPGQTTLLRPAESRYQLLQPALQTVPCIALSISSLNAATTSERTSTVLAPRVRIASRHPIR